MKKILIISILETKSTHRIVKEIDTLKNTYHVEFMGLDQFSGGKISKSVKSFWWFLKNLRSFDYIHFHTIFSLIYLPLIILKKWNTKIVYEEREYYLDYFKNNINLKEACIILPLYFLLRPFIKLLAHGIVVPVPDMKDRFWKNKTCVVAFNYPDLEQWEKIPANNKLNTNKTYLVYHGGINENRGIMLYPEILKNLNNPNIHLLIIGGFSGDDKKRFQDLCKKLNIENQVTIAGKCTYQDTIAYLRNTEKMIGLCLLKDVGQMAISIPVKTYEYVACEKPQIASDIITNFVENIEKHHCGLSVPYGDIEACTKAIQTIIDNYNEYEVHCKKAKALYNWKKEGEKILTFYQSL